MHYHAKKNFFFDSLQLFVDLMNALTKNAYRPQFQRQIFALLQKFVNSNIAHRLPSKMINFPLSLCDHRNNFDDLVSF